MVTVSKTSTQVTYASSYAAKIDLAVILDYVTKKHPEIVSRLPQLAVEYRKYMFLLGTNLFHNISVPSNDVDLIWHAHILHTVLYADFCNNLAGHFIHHNPFGDNLTTEEKTNSQNSLTEASLTIFGENVFASEASSGDCGYCGGCSNCAGDCGAA